MGEHYEAFKLASALDHGDLNYVGQVLLQDAQIMDPNTFSNMLNDANQSRRNQNSDLLQSSTDQNGLPVVNIVNPYNNQIDQQVELPAPPPPPPEQYQYPQGGQYPPSDGQYQPQYGDQPPPPPPPPAYYGDQPQGYDPNPNGCGARTLGGAVLGGAVGALLSGGHSRGLGIGLGVVAGGALGNAGCQ